LAALGIVRLMMIARFVPASDIGLVAMANTALAFAGIFSEMGLNSSLLHHQKVAAPTVNALFWAYLVLGLGLYGVCWGAAPLIALFFEDEAVVWVFQISALSLIFGGLGQLPAALLYKELAYAELSRAALLSSIFGSGLMAALAIAGYGVYALLGGMLFISLLRAGLLLYWGRRLFAPFGEVRFGQVGQHLRFGAYQTAERLVNTFNTRFDILIVGRFLGAEVLGSYELLKRLLERPMRLANPVVTRLITPILARRQQDKAEMKRLYLDQIMALGSINFPFYVLMAFAAQPVIELLLSEAYVSPENLRVFALLCLYYMVYTVQNPIGTIVIASGLVRQSFLYNLGIFAVLPFLLWISSKGGLSGIVAAMVAFHFAMIFAARYFLLRPAAGIQWNELARAIGLPLLISTLTIGVPVGLFTALWSAFWSAVTSGAVAALLYALGTYWWNRALVERVRGIVHTRGQE